MSFALSWYDLMHPENAGSSSDSTEERSILLDPDFPYGIDIDGSSGDRDSEERDGVSLGGATSGDEENHSANENLADDYEELYATSGVPTKTLENGDDEETRNFPTSDIAAATDKDRHARKDSDLSSLQVVTAPMKRAGHKFWQHETLPLYQDYAARQVNPPLGERVSIEYNNATQFMLGGLQMAGNRSTAPCRPHTATDNPSLQDETLGCFTHLEAWARQILLNHNIAQDGYDESVLHSLMMFTETFYEGFVHSTEQLLKESLARQEQRRSPILELEDFSFGVDVRLKLTPPFHNITSTRVFQTMKMTKQHKDLQRKINYLTGKMDEASEEEDVPRQTRKSKAKALKQAIKQQQQLGRVDKAPAISTKPKNNSTVSVPPAARKSKKNDTPTPTPNVESISVGPKRQGCPPKSVQNPQPILAISSTSAYEGGRGKDLTLLDNTPAAPINGPESMPPPPAPIMLRLRIPSGSSSRPWAIPQAQVQSASSSASVDASTGAPALSFFVSGPGARTTSSLHPPMPIGDAAPRQRQHFLAVPANLAGQNALSESGASAEGSLSSVSVPYDYPTPADSPPPSPRSYIVRVLEGEDEAQDEHHHDTLTTLLPSPATLARNLSDVPTPADADVDVTLKATPRRGKRKVILTPKAEELMQTRARTKARAGMKHSRLPTQGAGTSTQEAGPSTQTRQTLGRKRKLDD